MLTAVIGHVDILYTQAPRVSVNMHTKLYVFFCDFVYDYAGFDGILYLTMSLSNQRTKFVPHDHGTYGPVIQVQHSNQLSYSTDRS